MQRIKRRMTLRRTAEHEAAHAVLSEAYGTPVVLVAVRRTAKTRQWVGFTRPKGRQLEHPVPSSVVGIAGSVVETLWHGESREHISGGDYRMLLNIGMPDRALLEEWPKMAHAWWLIWELAAAEVRKHEKAIRSVGAALMRRKRLTGDEVRALIKKAR